MGPLLMTGLACFGAAVGIGHIVSGTWRSDGKKIDRRKPNARGLAIILIAFCEGIAVIGVVIGLLDVMIGPTGEPADGLLAAGPAIAGAVTGLVLILPKVRRADRIVALFAVVYVIALAVLGIVVAILAFVIDGSGTGRLVDWPFVVSGLVSGASALAIGWSGAPRIRAMEGVDEAAAKEIVNAAISCVLPFEIAAVAASFVAIVFIVGS